MAVKHPFVNKANKYARDIISGKIVSCLYVKLSASRHINDLEKSKKPNFPYKFDLAKAEKAIKFAQMMPHTKGKWSGSLIVFEPWQCFIFACLFGWVKKSNNLRRFKEVYAEIPRKNGKSIVGSVIGKYMFSADGEPGAEVYSGATTLAQALEVFRPAWLQTSKTTGYKNRFGIELGGTEKNPGNIYSMSTGSRFEAVVGKPGDGASVHCGIVDEYHEHKDDTLFDCFDTGMGAREQPILAAITTAGTNTSYPCFAKRNQVISVLEGKKVNDEMFGIIFTIDKEDDWTDFEVWKKANPNYNVSVFGDYLKRQHQTAIQNSRKQNILKCKHLNIWSNAGSTWLNSVEWEKASDPTLNIDDFWGDPVFLGLDLASKIDLAACMPLFKRDGHYYLFSKLYMPEDRTKGEEFAHYAGWAHDGYITITPGSRIDIDYIQEDIEELARNHDMSGEENGGGELCFDQYNTAQLVPKLDSQKIECVEIPQTVKYLSEPMKEIEAALKDGKFHHDGNPVTTWAFGNVTVFEDRNGNIFPRKEGAENKIDPAVATSVGMCRAMVEQKEVKNGNYGSLLDI